METGIEKQEWAVSILLETGAARRCEVHEYVLQGHPDKVNAAVEVAKAGTGRWASAEDSEELIRGAYNRLLSICPGENH